MEQNQKKKGGFASGFGFVMAAAGSAVGLGNLWAFPYKTAENGGAAFVFIYIMCVILIGSITMICEVFIGRRAQANPVSAFKKTNKGLGWIGLLAIIVPTIIVCYYIVLGGYTVKFAVGSFAGNAEKLGEFAGSGWLVVLFTAIFTAFSLVVVMFGIKGGIEKASKILMPTLFGLLVLVVIFVLCLGDGVADGLAFYLIPDFSKVTFGSVLAAMGQAFYSLSLGMGTMIVYGSYTGKEINIVKSTAMVCIFDTIVALLAGLAIFPAVFHFAASSGISPDKLELKGLMLMFETLPKVFESIGVLGNIIEFMFFAMVTIAAVTSVISIMEVASQFVIQKFKIKRKIATSVIAIITFALSIPISFSLGCSINGINSMTIFGCNWLTFLDTVTNTILMPVCALLSCLTVGWFIGTKQTLLELKDEGNSFGKLEGVVKIMIRFFVPLFILIVEIFGLIDLIFPAGVFNADGLGIALISIILLSIIILIYFLFLYKVETGTNADELDNEENKRITNVAE